MNKHLIFLLYVISFRVLFAQTYEPIPAVQNLLPLVSVDSLYAYVQHLESYQTRYALASNQLEIATWIAEKFHSYGITNTYLQEYQRAGITQYNVIATIPGYQSPEKYVIVSAHYDSQSLNTDPLLWAPGADDNASGTAAMLEMARVMKLYGYQPRCTIRFIAISNEELNAWGSEEYCDYAHSQNHDIRVMVNMDMLGSNIPVSNEFYISSFSGAPSLHREAIAYSEPYTYLDPVASPLNYGGDGGIFDQAGYHSLMFIERYLSPMWHTGQDTIDNLDFQYAQQILRAALATTAIFANQPPVPNSLRIIDTGLGSSLQARWDSSEDPEVENYAVFYGTDLDSLVLWQYTSATQCTISGLTEGQLYHIAVAAVNNSGYPGMRIYSGETPQSLPKAPQGLIDSPNTQSIRISWKANTELDVVSYSIYRKLGQSDNWSCIGSVASPDTCFTDPNIMANQEYYFYQIYAIDNQGYISPPSEPLSSRLVSLNSGILIVDESKNFSSTNPFLPSDSAVDEFYNDLLQGYGPINFIDLEENDSILRLADIGIYSSVLWHGNDKSDYSYPHQIQQALRDYIYLGGQVLFSIYFPSHAFELNTIYPNSFIPGSFTYDVLGVCEVDYHSGARFKYATPTSDVFPSLSVDNEKTISSLAGHIMGVEGFQTVNPQESIYLYASDYSSDINQGILNGSCVGIMRTYGSGKLICLSFPLFNMLREDAEAFVDYVFSTVFEEPSVVTDPSATSVLNMRVTSNYPNPFRTQTTFTVHPKTYTTRLHVAIYNTRGQIVNTIYEGLPTNPLQLTWDGRDSQGNDTGSGIYFIKASEGNVKVISRILRVK